MKSIVMIASVVIFFVCILMGVRSEKIVIDTDAGADDAAAILLVTSACQSNKKGMELVAITCVYGNTKERNVEVNVLKTLTMANASHIPVYRGAEKPLMTEYAYSDHYFGDDGFGDFEFELNVTAEVDESIPAAVALINLAKKYKGQLSILALGPLTNIALAISLDKDFVNNVNKFYIMGGSVTGMGNKSPGVEFNFGTDPESNYIVLNATKTAQCTLFTWEATAAAEISMEWRTEIFGSLQSSIVKFLNKAERKSMALETTHWNPADAMTAAVMLWPDIVSKKLLVNVTPVYDGAARGTLLVDYYNSTDKPQNVEIVEYFDAQEFKDTLLYYFG